ncbi:MAG: vWA domain-containing protein, partial [Candidatus Binatia bacterium]
GAAARGKTSVPGVVGTSGGLAFSASPTTPVSFTGTLDRGSVLVGGDASVRMELVIGAPGAEERAGARVPTDLVVILDRSGSMQGGKMEHARAAIRELVGELAPEDRFALVTYSNGASLAIAPMAATSEARSSWLATVAAISPDGGTNLSSGLDLGLETIDGIRAGGRVPRAIVISDGLANQGDYSPDGLVRRATRAARGEYPLTTVGVGADFNETLMRSLADAGTGNYYYVSDPRELGNVFAREFDAARTTVASALEVRIAPAAGVQVTDAAGYPLERSGDAVVFRPGSLFAGQERRIWVTLAVPNQAAGEHPLGRFELAYARNGERSTLRFDETPEVASVAREDDFYASLDGKTWERSVVVDDYNKMQEEVAREVKSGNRDEAIRKIESFRGQAAAINTRVMSAPVQQKLDSLKDLEKEVASAFEGDDQVSRQNELSKAKGAKALDERRLGAKR